MRWTHLRRDYSAAGTLKSLWIGITAVHVYQFSFRLGSHCRMCGETIYDGFITQRARQINFSLELHCHKCTEPAFRIGSHYRMNTRAAFRLGSHCYKCIELWLGWVHTVLSWTDCTICGRERSIVLLWVMHKTIDLSESARKRRICPLDSVLVIQHWNNIGTYLVEIKPQLKYLK